MRFRQHLNLLKTLGARVVIVAECTRCIHGDRTAALGFNGHSTPSLTEGEWPKLTAGLQYLAAIAATEEMALVYHHHMGTVIQAEVGSDTMPVLATVSSSANNARRTWTKVEDFMQEVADGRICDGVHFRTSAEVGTAMGRKIGKLAAEKYLTRSR